VATGVVRDEVDIYLEMSRSSVRKLIASSIGWDSMSADCSRSWSI
jgi:hypothetical protein